MAEVKKTKKKNKVASLLLALALILTCGVAGTIAQYQKSLGGSATANIAKFDVSATGLDETNSQTFNLFSTVRDTLNADGTIEKDTKTGLIAPGTYGYLDTTLTNNSEVNVNYQLKVDFGDTAKINYKGTDTNLPLLFAISDTNTLPSLDIDTSTHEYKNWFTLDQLKNAKGEGKLGFNGNSDSLDTSKQVYIFWMWEITDNLGVANASDDNGKEKARSDRAEFDTAIGEAMKSTPTKISPTGTISVVFSQVD